MLVALIARTQNLLMTMSRFFGPCPNGNSCRSFGHVLLEHPHGSLPVLLETGILRSTELLRFYNVMRLAGYDPLLCFLAICSLREIYESRFKGDDLRFFCRDFKTQELLDVPALCDNRWPKTGSCIIVVVPSHEV